MKLLKKLSTIVITLSLFMTTYIGIKAENTEKKTVVKINSKYATSMLLNLPLSSDLQIYVKNLAYNYGIDHRIVYAIMAHESHFNPNAYSTTNDYGLMQINGCHLTKFANLTGSWNMFDPYANVHYGIKLLSDLYRTSYGRNFQEKTANVLMKYQYGEGGAFGQYNQGIYTSEFVSYVLRHMYDYV